MKTSGIKIENFPILGEVTCKARDPFSSSLPGESFSLFCVFFSFSFGPLPLLLLFQEADHLPTIIKSPARPLLLPFLFSGQQQQPQQRGRSSCKNRGRTEADRDS